LCNGLLSFSITRLCACLLAAAFTLLGFCAGAAPVTLDFSTGTQGFVDSGAAGGTLTYATNIGSGSLRLTNPAGWIWRARLDVNNASTGILGSVYAALQAAGSSGGKLRFDLILTNTAATSISTGFGGVSYLAAVNSDSANGGGWDQLVATNLPASAFPIAATRTIPIEIPLVASTNTPANGNDSVLSLNSSSTWFQVQLGTAAANVGAVEWYIDNLSVEANVPPPPTNGPINLEAETGVFTGNLYVSTATPGYSGAGYVTGFQTSTDMVSWTFSDGPGLYDLAITFRSPYGPKGFNGSINGHGFSGMFPQSATFAVFDAGLVEVVPGANTLQVGGGWAYYDLDRVVLTPASAPPAPASLSAALVDPLATFAARSLMASLVADYGKYTWAGQHDRSEIAFIQATTGRKPAIVEGDLIDYSPSRVQYQGRPANYTESYIALESAGHVLGLCWHWNAPTNLLDTPDHEWWRGFYTDSTTFDVAAALANTNSVEYSLLLRDIDAIAVQLKKVASNNVPVLWRPLHEASGGWFWWGAQGPEPFKSLWRLLYNRLTTYHNLHNLIWVLTNEDPTWHPGNDVVDVIGVDAYPADPSDVLSSNWQALKSQFDGVKLLALTEFGGVPDIERMQFFGVYWAYFSCWSGSFIESAPPATVTRIYQSPAVIALDELNARPPLITAAGRMAGGAFQVSGRGPRGAAIRLLAAPDLAMPLSNWSVLTNSHLSGGIFTFTDGQAANNTRRYYRAVLP
jgi:mannan endo-1,4-beta-mannosidase